MAWTSPRTWAAGEVVSNSILNTHLRDNLRFLKGNDGTTVLEDSVVLTGTAHLFQANIVTSANLPATATGAMVYHTGSANFLFGEVQGGALKWLDRRDITVMTAASQATGDLFYAAGPTSIARLAAGGSGSLLQGNGAAAPSWTVPPGGMAVLRSGSGTFTASSTVDNFNVVGLATADKLGVFVSLSNAPTGSGMFLSFGTGAHDLQVITSANNSSSQMSNALLGRGTNATALFGMAALSPAGTGSAIGTMSVAINYEATLNTSWVGTWTLALVARAGTGTWTWNVYQYKSA